MKLVYLAHPVAGDVPNNLAKAKRWLKWIFTNYKDVSPVSDWILLCELFDDGVPENRAQGFKCNFRVLEACEEVWLVGGRISPGMKLEADHAVIKGLLVRDLTSLGDEPPVDAIVL